MKYGILWALLAGVSLFSCAAWAQSVSIQSNPGDGMTMHHDHMSMNHEHGAPAVPLSFTELTQTATMLETARRATEKYKDVHAAEADGYKATGPDVPGMGVHFVGPHGGSHFDVEQPSILLYEKDPSAPGGYTLVGVSYLLTAEEGPDGQPANPPFPKTLAQWHRHNNICVMPDRSVPANLSQDQCTAQGGQFTAETQWMVHAWIWKDSPTGVFAPSNPTVR